MNSQDYLGFSMNKSILFGQHPSASLYLGVNSKSYLTLRYLTLNLFGSSVSVSQVRVLRK